ncbi:N-acetylmuramic acid 6-phosphate etherase [Sporolactobacillus sp. THM7-7]|nr:N-acetylmuramic acid 6-phosphate etherase [Sporolactobacillus sp. THM7-7]
MLNKLTTEAQNSKTMDLDMMSIHDILKVMNEEEGHVPRAVSKELNNIEKIVKNTIRSLNAGGRLIYLGAGTSGRLGILDAVECVPTFNVSSDQVIGLIAGGKEAFTESVEGAEDNEWMGANDLEAIALTDRDMVIGLAASGRTPYVVGGLKYARKLGAQTASVSCNKNAPISQFADTAVEVKTGPEVLTGSTRLKAGSAQKLILNMISTASMIGIGKVYKNLMVDVLPTNQKLVERSKRIITQATDVNESKAEEYYKKANRNVKAAILMILLGCSLEEAEERLKSAKGFIRKAL